MKKKIRWLALNGCWVAAALAGLQFRSEGALNVFKFATWTFFIIALLAACMMKNILKTSTPEKAKEFSHSVPKWLSHSVDLAVIVFLCWHGRLGYASLVAATYYLQGAAHLSVDEYLEKASTGSQAQ